MQHGPGSVRDDLESTAGRPGGRIVGVAIGLWLALVLVGMAALWRYATEPGAPTAAPDRFPAESALRVPPGSRALLVFAHPRCTCTRATLAELAVLLARARGEPAAYVVITGPAEAEGDLEASEAFQLASDLPGVRVVVDREGREAALFGARTSGSVLVYDVEGKLAFHGGITGSRGHVGDNLGRARALAALGGGENGRESAVFGCRIDDDEAVGR